MLPWEVFNGIFAGASGPFGVQLKIAEQQTRASGGKPAGNTEGPRPPTSHASTIDILLPNGQPVGSVQAGAGRNIQTVTSSEFLQLQSRLTEGAVQIGTPANYRGTWYERSAGSIFCVRTSTASGTTIDVVKSGDPNLPQGFKVHQK